MKIYILTPKLNKGGAERVVSVLANEWSKKHEVVILYFGGNIDYKFSQNIKIYSLNININKLTFYSGSILITAYFKLKKYIKKEKSRFIIYGFLETSNMLLSLLKIKYKDKIIAIGGSHIFPSKYPKFYHLFFKIYNKLDKLVVVSNGIKNYYIDKIKIFYDKVIFIPNPAEINNILKLAEDRIPLLLEDEKKKNKVIISIGRLVAQKNFTLLIRSFNEALMKEKNLILLILGEGEDRNKLEKLIIDLGLSHKVFLPGQVENPFVWLKNSDLFVMSSNFEGWPYALIEAMVLGLPIISTDCPTGPAEILSNGKYGMLVPSQNQVALASAILQSVYKKKLKYKFISDWDVSKISEIYLNLIS